jgi:hypothetical protein
MERVDECFLIDTGRSSGFYPGGRASALEIRDGRFTAFLAGNRMMLVEPGERAAPSRRQRFYDLGCRPGD